MRLDNSRYAAVDTKNPPSVDVIEFDSYFSLYTVRIELGNYSMKYIDYILNDWEKSNYEEFCEAIKKANNIVLEKLKSL